MCFLLFTKTTTDLSRRSELWPRWPWPGRCRTSGSGGLCWGGTTGNIQTRRSIVISRYTTDLLVDSLLHMIYLSYNHVSYTSEVCLAEQELASARQNLLCGYMRFWRSFTSIHFAEQASSSGRGGDSWKHKDFWWWIIHYTISFWHMSNPTCTLIYLALIYRIHNTCTCKESKNLIDTKIRKLIN